jgi:excisionase family DNA binding protein
MSMEENPPRNRRKTDFPQYQGSGETEPLLTVGEVARYLRLEPETVRAMARRGELPALKVGRVWRFNKSLLKETVEKHSLQEE